MSTDPRELLTAPFELDEIELLPKYTGPMKEVNGRKVPANERQQCRECGGFHAFPAVHLSYVGHAGITKRLNDVDPDWSWEPMALTENGTPLFTDGGMWIRLTILGKTLPAFGDAQGKTGPNAVKEIIGDAIRNGAMRFGVGTYLWSKSEAAKAELTRQGIEDDDQPRDGRKPESTRPNPTTPSSEAQRKAIWAISKKLGISEEQLHGGIKRDTGKDHVDMLTKAEASALIEKLKKLEEATDE